MDPCRDAIRNESRPRGHYGLADRERICTPGEGEGVSTSGACRVIRGVQHAELELADGDHGHRYALGQFPKWTSRLVSDEDGRVEQPSARRAQRLSRVSPTSMSSSRCKAGSAARSRSCSWSPTPESQRTRWPCGTISATGSPCTVSVTSSPALTASTTCPVRLRRSRTPL